MDTGPQNNEETNRIEAELEATKLQDEQARAEGNPPSSTPTPPFWTETKTKIAKITGLTAATGVGLFGAYKGTEKGAQFAGDKTSDWMTPKAKNVQQVPARPNMNPGYTNNEPNLPLMVNPVITPTNSTEFSRTNLPPGLPPLTPPSVNTNSLESAVTAALARANAESAKLRQQVEDAAAKQAALEKKHAAALEEQAKMFRREVQIVQNVQTPIETVAPEKTIEQMKEERREMEAQKRMAEIEARNTATEENNRNAPVGYKMGSTTELPPLRAPAMNKAPTPKPTGVQFNTRPDEGVKFNATITEANREAIVNAIPRPPVGVNVISRGMGGYNITTAPNPGPVNIATEAPTNVNDGNPFKLSQKALEEIEDIYERNLVKIFPKNTLGKWMNINKESAYDFMSKPREKVPKEYEHIFTTEEYKRLCTFLEKLKVTTGELPKLGASTGKPESIQDYMNRTMQKAASQGLLSKIK